MVQIHGANVYGGRAHRLRVATPIAMHRELSGYRWYLQKNQPTKFAAAGENCARIANEDGALVQLVCSRAGTQARSIDSHDTQKR